MMNNNMMMNNNNIMMNNNMAQGWNYPVPAPPSIPPPGLLPPDMNTPQYNHSPYLPPPMMSPHYPYAIPPTRDPFLATLSCHSEVLQCLTRSFCCCFMGNEAIRSYRHGYDYK